VRTCCQLGTKGKRTEKPTISHSRAWMAWRLVGKKFLKRKEGARRALTNFRDKERKRRWFRAKGEYQKTVLLKSGGKVDEKGEKSHYSGRQRKSTGMGQKKDIPKNINLKIKGKKGICTNPRNQEQGHEKNARWHEGAVAAEPSGGGGENKESNRRKRD